LVVEDRKDEFAINPSVEPEGPKALREKGQQLLAEEAAEYASIHSAAEKGGFSATGFPMYGILGNPLRATIHS